MSCASLKEETCPLKSLFSSQPYPGAQKPAPPSQPGLSTSILFKFLPFSVRGCDALGLSYHLAVDKSSHFAVSFGIYLPPAHASETLWEMPAGNPGGLTPKARCKAWKWGCWLLPGISVGGGLGSLQELPINYIFVSGHPCCQGTAASQCKTFLVSGLVLQCGRNMAAGGISDTQVIRKELVSPWGRR